MNEITLHEIRESAKKIVAEFGEKHVYEPVAKEGNVDPLCQYTFENAPSCLVGRVLFDLGVSVEELVGLDLRDVPAIYLHEQEGLDGVDYRGAFYLSVLQADQDAGNSWGQALAHAERVAVDRLD